MRTTVTIHKGKNYLRITDYSPEFVNRVIYPFCKRYLCKYGKVPVPGQRKAKMVVTHTFGRMSNDKKELRISSGLLDRFLEFMNYAGYNTSRAAIVDEPVIRAKKVEFKWNEGWGEPRPHQIDWCEYQRSPGYIKVNNMQTGGGKSWCAANLMEGCGVRTLITALPRYISIWTNCLFQYFDLKIEDVVVLSPGNSIEDLANNIENGKLDPKVIIIPLTRYDSHLKRERQEEGCPCLDDLFSTMGIGLRVMDEGHESVYQVYMSMLYGNFEKTLALSATLQADDQFTNQIYDYIYPRSARFKDPEMKKYIDVFAYHHFIDVSKYRIKSKGFGGYSHVKFEQSILKSVRLTQMYYELVKKAFDEFYVKDLLDKQKCLFFFATVEMCVQMLSRLKSDYPDFDIVKFTNEESSDKELKYSYMEHQVVLTTPQSCGTGKDIPYLYVVISPYAVSSKQRNAQMLGRLREIDKWWPDLSPKFVYFVCRNIQKQIDYHEKRIEEFANKSKSHKNINSEHYIT